MAEPARAVFFDLDGTLVRDGAADAAAQAIRALADRHPRIDADRLRSANGEVWESCWREKGERWARGELPDDAVARGVWRLTLERVEAPAAVTRGLLEEAVSLHLAAERRTFTLFDETRGVLDELRRRGIRLGLITNGPSESQREKLRRVGIDGLFDLVIASGDVGVLKPDAAIFALAVRELGVPASASLHAGDNFDADVVGAHRAGLTAVWIARDGARPPQAEVPHHTGDSLEVVLGLVA